MEYVDRSSIPELPEADSEYFYVSDISVKVEQVLRLTENLAKAVSEGLWIEAECIEKERLDLFKAMLSMLDNNAKTSDQAELLALMHKILSMDASIRPLIVDERDRVARELLQMNTTAQAEKAYRSCAGD